MKEQVVFDIGERRRAASRFMGRVQREVQRAVAFEKQTRKLTQQQIADMLETSKSVINREILGGNLTLRRLGELAWALGYEIIFEFRKRDSARSPRPIPHAGKDRAVKEKVNPYTHETPEWHMFKALALSLRRLTELNRDDEAGMRTVIANAIAKAPGQSPERTGK